MHLKRSVLFCLLVIGVVVLMKLLPARSPESVGPAFLGVDAVTGATMRWTGIGSGGTGTKTGSSKKDAAETPVVQTAEGVAQFVNWQRGTDHGKPVLMVEVAPAVGYESRTAVLVVPNKNDLDSTVNPPDAVQGLASSLRIGDRLQITFSKPADKFVVVNMASAGQAGDPAAAFVFAGTRTIQVKDQACMAVLLRRKHLGWAMVVPNDPAGAAAATGRLARPAPDKALAERISRFRSGDMVSVDYTTADFQFVLKEMWPVQFSGRGEFCRSGKEAATGQGYATAVIRTGGNELVLFVPPADATAGAASGAALKDVKPGDSVEFKYHRECGYPWLDEIARAAQ
jgi:hypothetical protein